MYAFYILRLNCFQMFIFDKENGGPPFTENWPHEGNIIFDTVSLRYGKEGKKVLNGLSCHIKAREKVSCNKVFR